MTSATSTAATTTGARHARQQRATARGVSALMYACQQGDVHRVRKILRDQPVSLLGRDRTGKSPLHYCSTSDNIRAAQAADLLVMAAPELVETHDEDGFTPLHLAVIAGNMPLVTFLLANNADVHAVDNEKHTVVHWATVCGETTALRAVLAAGAPVSTPDIHGGYPLHYAAQMCGGDKDANLGMQVLQALLTHSDVAVSVEDGDGRQPLLWAASAGSAKAVLALVRAGAAVEAPDKDGLTALHCAASRGHTDCIDSLLTLCGASPDVIDSNGCTALHYAVTLGHADATALLLAHGADPNRQDRKGRSPAHCGCAKGQFETVKMIGTHGANLWLKNARGDLPLHEAAASGRRDLVRWLLDMRPSQVNARNNDGRCPLHLAALNDNVDMCKILLDAGAQINPILRTSKNTFMTPLDCALQRGFRSTAKYLQLHGGLPANRLGDKRTGPASNVNVQMKEDVMFWGDTSSDSERENGEEKKNSKRIQRKKLLLKYEKKRASLSGSDLENARLFSGKLENEKANRKLAEKKRRVKTGGRTDSASSTIDQSKRSNRRAPSGRFDYTNEIVINGKTEINIHQTKQITITPEAVATIEKTQDKLLTEVNEKETTHVSVERDKKVKSARLSGKTKVKSAKAKEENDKRKTKAAKEDASVKEQKNLNQSIKNNEIATKEIEHENIEENVETTGKLDNDESNFLKTKSLPDQQSIISNTSEDIDDHKNLIVEAAIHEPPKELKATSVESEKPVEEPTMEKPEDSLQESKTINEQNEEIKIVNDTNNNENDAGIKCEPRETETKPLDLEHTPDVNLKQETVCKDETTKEIIKDKTIDEHIDEAIAIVESKHETDGKEMQVDKGKTEEILQKSMEEKSDVGNEESNHVEGGSKKYIKDEINEQIKSNGSVGLEEKLNADETANDTAEILTGEVNDTLQESINIHTENKLDNQVDAGENVQKTQEITEDLSENITKEINAQSEETLQTAADDIEVHNEVMLNDNNIGNQTEQLSKIVQEETVQEIQHLPEEITDIVTSELKQSQEAPKEESTAIVENDKMEEKSHKSKSKKKNHRKRRSVAKPGDQAYEIIYKTLADDEDDTTAKEVLKSKKIQDSISKSKSSEEYSSDVESDSSTSTSATIKEHKSFRVLNEKADGEFDKKKPPSKRSSRRSKSPPKKQRSRSEENQVTDRSTEREKLKRSKIPTPLKRNHLSKSDKHLDVPDRKVKSSMESRVPSLPNIHENRDRGKEHPRSESNMSAPLLASIYSDNERGSGSDLEEQQRSSAVRKRKIKKRSKTREARSAGSDYESSNIIDSGFEPSPRSSRIPKWKNMTERGVNMSSVTQSIQTNIRRYHLERKIFQHLLELKRMQIRAGQHNEALLVKRAIDAYHQSCAATVGAGRYIAEDYTFKSFEKFLYLSLRKLQRNGADYLKGLPETPTNPLLCTQSTHRCMHATHAYTGIPCAAYLPRMDHHSIPKIGFTSTQCKPGTAFLPTINPKKAVTLELCHGNDKQVISLPADRLDQNKRYYVTFTVKGSEGTPSNEDLSAAATGHTHSKSD